MCVALPDGPSRGCALGRLPNSRVAPAGRNPTYEFTHKSFTPVDQGEIGRHRRIDFHYLFLRMILVQRLAFQGMQVADRELEAERVIGQPMGFQIGQGNDAIGRKHGFRHRGRIEIRFGKIHPYPVG